MTKHFFNINAADSSWHSCLKEALTQVNPDYLDHLYQSHDWLPGPEKIFNAFSLPVDQVKYVLFGESPYPRKESANGYAFWDNAVNELWSKTGLSKPVNRATSLRNMIKMLLITENLLPPNQTTQEAIATLDKKNLVQTNQAFFNNLLQHGFLLLNATLVLQPKLVKKDAAAWLPFITYVLTFLLKKNPQVELVLFGQIANEINKIRSLQNIPKFIAEHPYNISFIQNEAVRKFFKPFHLLKQS